MADLHIRSVLRETLPPTTSVAAWLVERVRTSVARGRPEPAIVVVREHTIDVIAVARVRESGMPLPWFLAGLTGSTTPVGGTAEAVGIVGALSRRRGQEGSPERVVTVFLEWADGRWWQWAVPMEEGVLLDARAEVLDARRGDALPRGLGRWWSFGRRHGVRLGLRALAPDPSGGMVH